MKVLVALRKFRGIHYIEDIINEILKNKKDRLYINIDEFKDVINVIESSKLIHYIDSVEESQTVLKDMLKFDYCKSKNGLVVGLFWPISDCKLVE